MKRGIAIFVFLIIFSSYLISAEILITQSPKNTYSLGDTISLPIKIKAVTDLSGILNMDLLCNGHTINFYKNGVSLKSGEEKELDSSLVLTRNVIGDLTGTCKIKATLNNEYLLTDEFKISDLITINTEFTTLEFNPGEFLIIEGSALKENGNDVNGYIEVNLDEGNSSIISQIDTINNGFFKINISIPKDIAAKTYLLKLNAYEYDISKEITNKGFRDQNILIKQIPTSLEVVFDTAEVEPGTNLKVKAILHDQTGEKINSTSFLTIKNLNDKIIEQVEMATDEFLEHAINYNEAPSEWKVVAVSNKLTSESRFIILKKESIDVKIINKTVIIKNIGNIPYNKTILVKIGENPLNINVYLDVDKEKKYLLTAPEGEYAVEIITGNEDSITADLALTGKAIDIKEASTNVGTLIKYPLVWIFLILILGFVAFVAFKRGSKKTFFGYIGSKISIKKHPKKEIILKKSSCKNSAELSLSIKGERQNASFVTLKIKNLKSEEGNAKEVIEKIKKISGESKASVYENANDIFFILAPAKTKTFGNEKTAWKLAEEIKLILGDHNKMSKQGINFGISITSGTIVAKLESGILKFTALGNLMNTSKKISSISGGEILLDEKTSEKLKSHLKTQKNKSGNAEYYSIKQIKNAEENEKFIRTFLQNLEKK